LAKAFAFAGGGQGSIGRIAVLPFQPNSPECLITDLSAYPWAVRAQRQAAFSIVPALQYADLKSNVARDRFGIRWYEFPIGEEDRACLTGEYRSLVSTSDDESAGFLRFHLTEYVEAHKKFSPTLADWLIERVPMAPRCYLVRELDGDEVVVNHRAKVTLPAPAFDEETEREQSRRYWSAAHPEKSWDRMTSWQWPTVGSVAADPRTYHGCYAG
jgi:hypothetical protein